MSILRRANQRRSFLKLGLIGTAVLAGGGFVAARLTDGSPAPLFANGVILQPASQQMLYRVFEAVLDGMLPPPGPQRTALLVKSVAGLDGGIQMMPPHLQAEVKDLLGLLTFAPARFALTGRWSGWASASVADTQAFLMSLRNSSVELKRLVYMTLHDLATSSYYSNPETWPSIGYPGPLVNSPGVEV